MTKKRDASSAQSESEWVAGTALGCAADAAATSFQHLNSIMLQLLSPGTVEGDNSCEVLQYQASLLHCVVPFLSHNFNS